MFTGGRWFISQNECKDFSRYQIPEGQLQWLIYIVTHLNVLTRETVSTAEYQRDEVHATKIRKTKEKSIIVLVFKMDIPPMLGGLGEGKDSYISLTSIIIPKLWNAHDIVRGFYPRASKSLHGQSIKLQAVINW